MKLPSIVRIAKPQRFNITPRYYDPIKEEIEQRTYDIKRELEEEGILSSEGSSGSFTPGFQSSIRGSFRSKSKTRSSSVFEKAGLLRVLIFVLLVGGLGGYIYLGNAVLYYLLYLTVGIGMWILLKRLKGRHRNE